MSAEEFSDDQSLTADEFAESRCNLPEGGRWYELYQGKPVLMQAPDDQHGNIVLNLSREFAFWLQHAAPKVRGYACHEVGLHVDRQPDTVLVPAISYFTEGPMFEQTERVIASRIPQLVIDIASTNDRRQRMQDRCSAYLRLGAGMIWIPDPAESVVKVIRPGKPVLSLGKSHSVEGDDLLPGFSVPVDRIFEQPIWWTRQK